MLLFQTLCYRSAFQVSRTQLQVDGSVETSSFLLLAPSLLPDPPNCSYNARKLLSHIHYQAKGPSVHNPGHFSRSAMIFLWIACLFVLARLQFACLKFSFSPSQFSWSRDETDTVENLQLPGGDHLP